MVLSVEHLSEYLESMLLSPNEAFPWSGETSLVVINYVVKFLFSCNDQYHGTTLLLSDTVRVLDDLASELDEDPEKESHILEIFTNSFLPEVKIVFRVPKLSEKDNDSLRDNEILSCFIDFLVQVLDCEGGRYALLRKELTFLVTFLGDTPFQCCFTNEIERGDNNLLPEFENLANEVGGFVYSCLLSIPNEGDSLLPKIGLLNEKIKECCVGFSENAGRFAVAPTRASAIDSLFIVDSLIEDLDNVLNARFHYLSIDDVNRCQIKAIHDEMMVARTILKGIETCKDELLRESPSNQIRDVAYEAEFLVNSYVVGNVPVWYLTLRLPNVVQKVVKLVGMALQESNKIYGIKALQVQKELLLQQPTEETPVDVDDNIVVGSDDELTSILGDLVEGSKSRQIVSIFGLPGLGKTTIARKLYKSRSTCDFFDVRAWCVVSQTYVKRNLLITIYTSLSGKQGKENITEMEVESLGLEIYKRLKGRRYLIVMDDVWDSDIWYDMRRYFPDDVNGSRIILTSRIRDTAPAGSIFRPLHVWSDVKCWDLLEKKVFAGEPCPSQLLCVGKEIAAKCHGLPLAVIIIAGTLAKLEKEENEWKRVKINLDSYIFDDPNGCLKILELSYAYLPNHLKECFLYLGVFPEDEEIRARKLMQLWIAEGFIPKQEEKKSSENTAKDYLLDLINRSLVMIGERRFDGGIKTCRVHDLLRDMCLRKAHDKAFLKCIKLEFCLYEKHQRLYVQKTPRCFRRFGLNCRSFIGSLSDISPGFSRMPLLRVMDILPNNAFNSVMEEIYLLVHLRYLAIPELPNPTLRNFLNLEVLCLNSNTNLNLSFVLKMLKLRHLFNKCMFRIEEDCDDHQTTSLLSLGDLLIENREDEEVLRCSPYLLKLKCTCDGALFPDLGSLTQLETINMSFSDDFKYDLTTIYFPSTIKKLKLSGPALPWEVMSFIGRLPNVQYLKLRYEAFMEENWETKDGEFQKLRVLVLESNPLKQWITSSEHFPKLQCLKLHDCPELEEIPIDLGNIPTLQTIEVNFSSYEASISAVRIEIEQLEYGNEELMVTINNHNWSKEQLVQECSN